MNSEDVLRLKTQPFVAAFVCFLCLLLVPTDSDARRRRKKSKSKPQFIILDGIREKVFWNDGDSFRVTKGPRKGLKARLADYNTLESYGPVHFWGGFNAWDLYKLAKKGTMLARSQEWECKSMNTSGGYGRVVVQCKGLTDAILKAGYAYLFTVGKKGSPDRLVKIQLEAQNKRRGIWAKGIPRWIVTSVHSMDEPTRNGKPRVKSYNRICDTVTGKTRGWHHTSNFKPCEAFCFGGSCMLYVSFGLRYGKKRPFCMREGWKSRLIPPPTIGTPLDKKRD